MPPSPSNISRCIHPAPSTHFSLPQQTSRQRLSRAQSNVHSNQYHYLRYESELPDRPPFPRPVTDHMRTRPTSSPSGISKANRPTPTIAQRRLASRMLRARRSPELEQKIAQMRLDIAPIVHVETGLPAPDFPQTMLHLFLLTEAQLDSFAHYYSQSTPSSLTHQYPQTMDWAKPFLNNDPELPANCKLNDLERVKVKMRMFARFIGMRGAETPRWEYERQVEILGNKIERSVREEERSLRKVYGGPNVFMP